MIVHSLSSMTMRYEVDVWYCNELMCDIKWVVQISEHFNDGIIRSKQALTFAAKPTKKQLRKALKQYKAS